MGELALPGEPCLFKDVSIQSVPTSWLFWLAALNAILNIHYLLVTVLFFHLRVCPHLCQMSLLGLYCLFSSLSVSIAQGQVTYRVWVSPGSHQTELPCWYLLAGTQGHQTVWSECKVSLPNPLFALCSVSLLMEMPPTWPSHRALGVQPQLLSPSFWQLSSLCPLSASPHQSPSPVYHL